MERMPPSVKDSKTNLLNQSAVVVPKRSVEQTETRRTRNYVINIDEENEDILFINDEIPRLQVDNLPQLNIL